MVLLDHQLVPAPSMPSVIEDAIVARRVLWIDYEDQQGTMSRRPVEPVSIVCVSEQWYLLAWCRLRDDARIFRLDRIARAIASDEYAPVRDFDEVARELPDVVVRLPAFA